MNKKDVYRLVTVENGEIDAAAILSTFSKIETGHLKGDIRLLNYYHEVPVNYGATVNAVENDSVELSIHEIQAIVVKKDRSTLINSRHFPKDLGVHCYATYVNVSKKSVILNNFSYAQVRAERREAVRVSVPQPIQVTFSHDGGSVDATMVDVSGNGLSVCSAAEAKIDVHQKGRLSFCIMGIPLSVPGTFVRVLAEGTDRQVFIFKIYPDRRTDTFIGQFIYQRQVEIINELKDGLIAD